MCNQSQQQLDEPSPLLQISDEIIFGHYSKDKPKAYCPPTQFYATETASTAVRGKSTAWKDKDSNAKC